MGKHKYNSLTDLRIRKLSKTGRYTDGRGLHLWVTKNQTKQWVLRVTIRNKRQDIGLGGYPDVPLAEAREIRDRMRAEIRAGNDPKASRIDAKREIPTFEQAAYAVLEANRPNWKNPKHADQWINTLKTYAFPTIGNRRVDDISPSQVITILQPIWLLKHETANRVRQRMSKVFVWAKKMEFSDRDNPAEGIQDVLAKPTRKAKHFSALSYEEIPVFLSTLHDSGQSVNVKLALTFLILCASRTKEVRFATWSEIDLTNKRWVIPPERMKNGLEHHVPLSDAAINVLKKIKPISRKSTYIFPSSINWKKPMSENTMLKAVKTLGFKITVHGFRSTFRDWASETMHYPNDVVEMVLAHSNPNKSEAAYKRGDLFEKRMKIMDDWASYTLPSK